MWEHFTCSVRFQIHISESPSHWQQSDTYVNAVRGKTVQAAKLFQYQFIEKIIVSLDILWRNNALHLELWVQLCTEHFSDEASFFKDYRKPRYYSRKTLSLLQQLDFMLCYAVYLHSERCYGEIWWEDKALLLFSAFSAFFKGVINNMQRQKPIHFLIALRRWRQRKHDQLSVFLITFEAISIKLIWTKSNSMKVWIQEGALLIFSWLTTKTLSSEKYCFHFR